MHALPYWRLSGYYFFYFAFIGAFSPYFGLYLQSLNFSAWDIGLQKTGYIVEAGRCLVMQARMAGRKFIMVFLDSAGKRARLSDAERIRRWIEMAAEEGSLGVYLPRAKLTS